MILIYHNPDSKESSDCIKILETSKHNHEVIKYDNKTLCKEKLVKIIKLLKVSPMALIRTKEKLWQEKFQHLINDGIEFSDDELIAIMIKYSELIERPIIINGDKAVIGKSPKNILDII